MGNAERRVRSRISLASSTWLPHFDRLSLRSDFSVILEFGAGMVSTPYLAALAHSDDARHLVIERDPDWQEIAAEILGYGDRLNLLTDPPSEEEIPGYAIALVDSDRDHRRADLRWCLDCKLVRWIVAHDTEGSYLDWYRWRDLVVDGAPGWTRSPHIDHADGLVIGTTIFERKRP